MIASDTTASSYAAQLQEALDLLNTGLTVERIEGDVVCLRDEEGRPHRVRDAESGPMAAALFAAVELRR